MKTITICSSASFYKQILQCKQDLEKLGYKVLVPKTALSMQKSGDYKVESYKTWYKNKNDYYNKTALMKAHFKEIEKADAILVINLDKHGSKNYIGGNVLIEMAIAFYRNTPIYLFNDIPEDSLYAEELIGMNPIILHGQLACIEASLK